MPRLEQKQVRTKTTPSDEGVKRPLPEKERRKKKRYDGLTVSGGASTEKRFQFLENVSIRPLEKSQS
jgi:hypothetical protein